MACIFVTVASKRDEVLVNFRASCRGALRRAPTILIWVQTLRHLRETTGDADCAAIIKRFNMENPKQAQLTGQKASAVKALLESYPAEALQLVEDHVMQMGWPGCCFSDDALSSKKLLPGFNFRLGTQGPWPKLGKVSASACCLAVRHTISKFMALPQSQRHKVTKSELEHTAQSATFVDSVSLLLLSEFPLEPEKLDAEWKEPFAKNDLAVTLEVQAALASKNPEFHPRSIKTLATLRLDFSLFGNVGRFSSED